VFNILDSSSKRYKIKDDEETFDELWLQKFRVEIDMTRVASNLIDHMVNRKEIEIHGVFEVAHVLLATDVLVIHSKSRKSSNASFKCEFLIENSDRLTEPTRKFQQIFIKEFQQNDKCRQLKFSRINKYLGDDQLRLRVDRNFGTRDFEEFFKSLTLATDQPNEDELPKFIKQDLKHLVPFTKKDLNDIYGSLESKIKHWYKTFCTKKRGFRRTSKEIWLTKITAIDWLVQTSNQHCSLINPMDPTRTTEKKIMEKSARNCSYSLV
jgi:hypothetical protein